jgi:hypothetical protein
VILCVTLPVTCYHGFTSRETGEHESRVSWLPAEATDVTYIRSFFYTVEEFSISEQGFLVWAKKMGWDVATIVGEVEVPRYFGQVTPVPQVPQESERAFDAWLQKSRAVVRDGYYARYRTHDMAGYTVAYDRKAGRVYYQANPR